MGKGKGKGFGGAPGLGNNPNKPKAPKDPNAPPEYLQILDQLVPLISALVDNSEGLMSMGQMMQNTEVKTLVDSIPDGCEKKIRSVLQAYPDYFAVLENGMIATYLGYENGLVDENDQVVKKGKAKKKNSAVADPAAAIAAVKEAAAVAAEAAAEPVDMEAAVAKLQSACYDQDQTQFYEAVAQVEAARAQQFGVQPPAGKKRKTSAVLGGEPPLKKTKEDKVAETERLTAYIEEFLTGKGGHATIQQITTDPMYIEMKKGVINKFVVFLEQHMDKWTIVPPVGQAKGSPQTIIQLLSAS